MQMLWCRDADPGYADISIGQMQTERWGEDIDYVDCFTSRAVKFSVRLALRVALVCKT